MKCTLVDTGFIVAMLDKSEAHHSQCMKVLARIDAPLLTCEAVIAEACHLVRRIKGASEAILSNIEKGNLLIAFELSLNPRRIRELLRRYSDVPMSLADACLVSLAEEYDTGMILTLDSDFEIYRWNKRRPFQNMLSI